MSDLGLRPSDVLNQDMCLLLEGANDVIFFEHVIRTLYAAEFLKVGVAILQYGGGAAEGIVAGTINVANIVPAQRYILDQGSGCRARRATLDECDKVRQRASQGRDGHASGTNARLNITFRRPCWWRLRTATQTYNGRAR